MKKYLVVLIAITIIVLIIFFVRGGEDKKNSEESLKKNVDINRQLTSRIKEMDKDRLEKLGIAAKNIKRLPFAIKQQNQENKVEEGTGLILGVVLDDERNQLKGCIVTLKGEGQPFTSARRSDMSGKFSFDKVEVGEYKVAVQCNEGKAERSGIKVEKDKVTNLEIQLTKSEKGLISTISGNVIDFVTRSPIEGAILYFNGRDEKTSEVSTDSLGRFTFNVKAYQKGKIIIEKEGYVRKVIDVDINEKEINFNNITLVRGNIKDDGQKYQGIGAALIEKNGEFVVAQVFENTPAAKAGLLKNDRIYQINGMDISSLRLDEIIALIRGDERTNVILTIKRGEDTKYIQIVRETIEIK